MSDKPAKAPDVVDLDRFTSRIDKTHPAGEPDEPIDFWQLVEDLCGPEPEDFRIAREEQEARRKASGG